MPQFISLRLFFQVLEKYIINIILGHDKEGNVIRYCPSGNVDFLGKLTQTEKVPH